MNHQEYGLSKWTIFVLEGFYKALSFVMSTFSIEIDEKLIAKK
jgi:hypothetical protein